MDAPVRSDLEWYYECLASTMAFCLDYPPCGDDYLDDVARFHAILFCLEYDGEV